MKWKLLTTLLILSVLSTSTASAQIIKELPQKSELENFTASITPNADYIDNATFQTIAQHPTWPHDVWRDEKGNYYKSFYCSNVYSDKGYTSVYYDSCGRKLKSVCNMDFELVYAYPGLEVEENDTDPVEEENSTDPIEEENDTDPIEEVDPVEEDNDIEESTTEEVTNETHSGFEMNVYNETTGAVVNIAAKTPDKVSEECQRDYWESIKHIYNAVLGWAL